MRDLAASPRRMLLPRAERQERPPGLARKSTILSRRRRQSAQVQPQLGQIIGGSSSGCDYSGECLASTHRTTRQCPQAPSSPTTVTMTLCPPCAFRVASLLKVNPLHSIAKVPGEIRKTFVCKNRLYAVEWGRKSLEVAVHYRNQPSPIQSCPVASTMRKRVSSAVRATGILQVALQRRWR